MEGGGGVEAQSLRCFCKASEAKSDVELLQCLECTLIT